MPPRQVFQTSNDIASVSAVESIPDFALALRELAASCNFAEQASDNMCDQFITGVASPQLPSRLLLEGDTLTFDRAVEIALLSERAEPRIVRQQQRQRDASGRSTDDSRHSNETRPLYQSRPSLPRARQASPPSDPVSTENLTTHGFELEATDVTTTSM
ncbi:hypothetical protein HPB50_011050 [Hyalomma asiaticum]|uniref:Uncharacterized protein n=1 Tax=Hyalomma asiaticum TaxID=266040 RepID=A0ACB7SVH4_HYAAI|nr:hypothetical protein HPB50_011050 [Hyalomma asiaticum]